ncbi:MAG: hypothetical protein LUD72_07420 [Bacteroidales bacterium]|nr:hypothetical protein [Bacteroidales bacterium]
MAKITEVTQQTADLVRSVAEESDLFHLVNIEPLAVSKQPVMIKVAKANAATEFKCQTEDLIFLYVYEEAFEKLTDEQRKMVVEEAMNQIHVDLESGKIKIIQPQLNMTVGGYAKHGQKMIDCAVACHTIVETLAKKEKKDEVAD